MPCLLIVEFAALKSDLKSQLIRIGQFLGVQDKYLQGSHLDCIVNHAEGNFKRPHKKESSNDSFFSDEMNNKIEKDVNALNSVLVKKFGSGLSFAKT